MAYKNDEDCFTPSKHSRVCAEHFSKESFEKNIVVPTIFVFPMASCKPAFGPKTTQNKRIMPVEQRANFSAIFQVK